MKVAIWDIVERVVEGRRGRGEGQVAAVCWLRVSRGSEEVIVVADGRWEEEVHSGYAPVLVLVTHSIPCSHESPPPSKEQGCRA